MYKFLKMHTVLLIKHHHHHQHHDHHPKHDGQRLFHHIWSWLFVFCLHLGYFGVAATNLAQVAALATATSAQQILTTQQAATNQCSWQYNGTTSVKCNLRLIDQLIFQTIRLAFDLVASAEYRIIMRNLYKWYEYDFSF